MLTLHVEFDDFLDIARELTGGDCVYVRATARGCSITAAAPDKQTVVSASTATPIAETIETEKAGAKVRRGGWQSGDAAADEADESASAYIAAVSYVSSDTGPGVWIDAFATLPTEMQTLREMYEEFRETGELGDVAFEEFVRLAKPTVAIVSPAEIRGYVAEKSEPPG